MIVLEKYEGDNKLETWTCSFGNMNELIKFMKKNKYYILGKGYKLVIRETPDLKIPEYLFDRRKK